MMPPGDRLAERLLEDFQAGPYRTPGEAPVETFEDEVRVLEDRLSSEYVKAMLERGCHTVGPRSDVALASLVRSIATEMVRSRRELIAIVDKLTVKKGDSWKGRCGPG